MRAFSKWIPLPRDIMAQTKCEFSSELGGACADYLKKPSLANKHRLYAACLDWEQEGKPKIQQ